LKPAGALFQKYEVISKVIDQRNIFLNFATNIEYLIEKIKKVLYYLL